MRLNILFITLLTLLSTALSAQKFTLSGTVKDAKTGEELIGILVSENFHLVSFHV